jgi:hypothetical protein
VQQQLRRQWRRRTPGAQCSSLRPRTELTGITRSAPCSSPWPGASPTGVRGASPPPSRVRRTGIRGVCSFTRPRGTQGGGHGHQREGGGAKSQAGAAGGGVPGRQRQGSRGDGGRGCACVYECGCARAPAGWLLLKVCRVLDRGHSAKPRFAECQIAGNRQSLGLPSARSRALGKQQPCRVPDEGHSANLFFFHFPPSPSFP